MSEICEILMMICFGASGPMNVVKSVRSKTTKGKSLGFLIMIEIGYICGMIAKCVSGNFKWYVMFFYVLNFVMVFADLVMYFYNYNKYDKKEKTEVK